MEKKIGIIHLIHTNNNIVIETSVSVFYPPPVAGNRYMAYPFSHIGNRDRPTVPLIIPKSSERSRVERDDTYGYRGERTDVFFV